MNEQQVVGLLMLIADLRLQIDSLAQELAAERQRTPKDE